MALSGTVVPFLRSGSSARPGPHPPLDAPQARRRRSVHRGWPAETPSTASQFGHVHTCGAFVSEAPRNVSAHRERSASQCGQIGIGLRYPSTHISVPANRSPVLTVLTPDPSVPHVGDGPTGYGTDNCDRYGAGHRGGAIHDRWRLS